MEMQIVFGEDALSYCPMAINQCLLSRSVVSNSLQSGGQ